MLLVFAILFALLCYRKLSVFSLSLSLWQVLGPSLYLSVNVFFTLCFGHLVTLSIWKLLPSNSVDLSCSSSISCSHGPAA